MKTGILATIFISVTVLAYGCDEDQISRGYVLERIQTDKGSLTLEVGEQEQISALAVPAVAVTPVFQWTSSNEMVAVVSNQGVVSALSGGETMVSVNLSDISTSVPVKVIPHGQSIKTYGDTIIRITIKGADCPFADHADYGAYIPVRSELLRGVIILQHGCGMEQFGITRPYDLQYQAFAKKWKLAVIETALYGNCGLWRDPASGSANALLKILNDVGNLTGHPELKTVPWLLWGHSAGGYWTLAMLKAFPERICAAVCYSAAWDPQWDYPLTAAKVPVLMRHAGANDGDATTLCQATAVHGFLKLRNMDAPVCIAYNAGQNHNFSYLRYMVVPFFEAVMEQRMPEGNNSFMLDLDRSQTWLGDTLTLQIFKESDYIGDKKGLCLFPDETTAKNWKEFVSTGKVADKTPPPAPFNVKVKWEDGTLEVSWEADADIESGILRFNVFKNGILAGKLPETDAYQKFDTNGDNTFPVNVPEMKFRITGAVNLKTTISVQTVNHYDLVSEKTEVVYNL